MQDLPATARAMQAVGLAAMLAAGPLASAQELAGPLPGYTEERVPQVVQNAPPGSVGRKTTDVTRRIGIEALAGNRAEHVLTIGGFARQCPAYVDGFGIVKGEFEYALRYDEAITAGGEPREYHHSRRLTATLEGRVGDDARLIDVEIDGEYTSDVNGERTTARIQRRFTPGPGGEPDWEAMRSVVLMSADVAAANAVLMGGTLYKLAEQSWRDPRNKCAEFTFDPPTESRALGPDQAEQVRVEVRAREGGATAPWRTDNINVKVAGRIAPKPAEARPGSPAVLTYTAASEPKRGHGFGLATETAVGVAEGRWTILERARYEGTFTYVDTGIGVEQDQIKVDGRLVWIPDDRPQASTFGETASAFFKPAGGEFTIDWKFRNRGLGGSYCEYADTRTFPVEGMQAASLRYLKLEVAEDGRYKLTLVIPDRPEPFPGWSIASRCVFPNATASDRLEVRGFAIVLGLQQGSVDAEQRVVGRLASPIRRGLRTYEGSWSFARAVDGR